MKTRSPDIPRRNCLKHIVLAIMHLVWLSSADAVAGVESMIGTLAAPR